MTTQQQAAFHLKIGGMACSLCTESIRKACARRKGLQEVHVSLAHEEATTGLVHPVWAMVAMVLNGKRGAGDLVHDRSQAHHHDRGLKSALVMSRGYDGSRERAWDWAQEGGTRHEIRPTNPTPAFCISPESPLTSPAHAQTQRVAARQAGFQNAALDLLNVIGNPVPGPGLSLGIVNGVRGTRVAVSRLTH